MNRSVSRAGVGVSRSRQTALDGIAGPMPVGLRWGATLVVMPLVMFNTTWTCRMTPGKVDRTRLRSNELNAYRSQLF